MRCNQREACASELGDDQSRYLFVTGSFSHNDEMCNLYVMYYAENGHKPYFTCVSNSFPKLFDEIPAGNDVPLPADPWLDAVAAGHVHKGIGSRFDRCLWFVCVLYYAINDRVSVVLII